MLLWVEFGTWDILMCWIFFYFIESIQCKVTSIWKGFLSRKSETETRNNVQDILKRSRKLLQL